MFIIDFDDTLFQTHKFKQMRVEALKSVGVPSSVDDEIYKKARNSPDGMLTYSNVRHAEILASYGYDYDRVLNALKNTTEKAVLVGLLADGAIDFLRYLRDQGQTLILLSLGSPEFQELKVRGCGIHELFDRMFMVYDTKEHVLKGLFEHIGNETVWFINDKIEETKKLCSKFSRLKPILKVSPLFSINDYTDSGIKYHNNFNEIQDYVDIEINRKQALDIGAKADKTGVVILAAGKGKRMRSDILKVMHKLNGRPLVDYVVSSVEKSAINRKPAVVVCQDDSAVQNYLGDRAEYVVQEKPLGTGHAVRVCENLLKNQVENIIVLYGDLPLISPESINKLIENRQESCVLALAVTIAPDFNGQYAPLYASGRIERNSDGIIIRIIEKKDCTEEQLRIKEINTGFYCFQANWLWDRIKELKNNNAQGEYYLTDLVAIAINNKERISSINIDPKEALGINTKEDLEIAQKYI